VYRIKRPHKRRKKVNTDKGKPISAQDLFSLIGQQQVYIAQLEAQVQDLMSRLADVPKLQKPTPEEIKKADQSVLKSVD
jgi:hypothetical protein